MLGPVVNAVVIILGALAGKFLIRGIPERFEEIVRKAIGLSVLYIGIKGTLENQNVMLLIFSMLIGFFFWYKGLALGGIAKVGQIQLVQPFIGLMFCAALLNEQISFLMIAVSLAVVGCVVMAKKYA